VKSVLCLSGWGQNPQSLEPIFNSKQFFDFSLSSLDYSSFACFDSLQEKLTNHNNPNVLIGWSLGGQIATRLIAKKIFSPKLLILIAPPFQMIKDHNIKAGMSLQVFNEFYDNFTKSADLGLKKFSILTAMNDINSSKIAKTLDIKKDNHNQLSYWLEELKKASLFNVDFSKMPRTLYFHGAGDMIVHVAQHRYFLERIKDFRLEIFKNCGHAPHLSYIDEIRNIIKEEIDLYV
jgi:pimeloyl-[acyl-carrier protein] methyl ester esterase